MRKLFIIALATFVAGFATNSFAEEYVKGGFEMSGHVNAGLGFQHNDKNAANVGTMNAGGIANPIGAVTAGPMGEFTQNNAAAGTALTGSSTSFTFFLDDVALAVSKSFGENIRLRADLDFARAASGSGAPNLGAGLLQQGYATANVPVGNGLEFLVGRFFAPIGYEKVYRNENNTVSHSVIFNMRSTHLTGVKFYYAFNDLIDWHVYVVNNLRDVVGAGTVSKNIPGFGTRLGFNWGEEGTKSTLGVTAQAGPESLGNFTATSNDKLGNWTYLGDVDWNVHVNDAFTIGGEALFRVDQTNKNLTKVKNYGAVVDLNYAFTDVWDGTLKYAYAHQNNGTANGGSVEALVAGTPSGLINSVGNKTMVNEVSLAGQYQIADGAKLQAEYRLDLSKATGTAKTFSQGAVLNFAYSF